jgi:hypothetical protein
MSRIEQWIRRAKKNIEVGPLNQLYGYLRDVNHFIKGDWSVYTNHEKINRDLVWLQQRILTLVTMDVIQLADQHHTPPPCTPNNPTLVPTRL